MNLFLNILLNILLHNLLRYDKRLNVVLRCFVLPVPVIECLVICFKITSKHSYQKDNDVIFLPELPNPRSSKAASRL